MDSKQITVKIERKPNEVKLKFSGSKISDILLTSIDSNDLKLFFENIFDCIIESKELINFVLEDDGHQDLFHDVSLDIVHQLNSEIIQSENNFSDIFQLFN